LKKGFNKRLLAIFLICTLILGISGCELYTGGDDNNNSPYGQLDEYEQEDTVSEYDDILDSLYDYYNSPENETDFTFEEIMEYYNSVYGDESDDYTDDSGDFPEIVEKSDILEELGVIKDKKVELKGNNEDTVTVMIYLNGSDLESMSGAATLDISEILEADLSKNVNVVIQTGGTSRWYNTSVSAKTSQRFIVKNHKLKKACNDLGQLNMTDGDTLGDFIRFCDRNYPADRNFLVLWNHGGGPVYGYGYDENVGESDTLTLDELQKALDDGGVYFDFIGFDACLMASIEVGYTLYNYADYMIASENFESGYGWEYKYWLSALGKNSSIETPLIAKMIIDNFVLESQEIGADGVLSLIDLRYMELLYSVWEDFVYENKDTLLAENYSWKLSSGFRAHPMIKSKRSAFDFMNEVLGYTYFLSSYNVVDMMAVASVIDSKESDILASALNHSIIYSVSANSDSNFTGLSATLPYGETKAFYRELKSIFKRCDIDSKYISFLGEFIDAEGAYDNYNWDNWRWKGWDKFSDKWESEENWSQWLGEHKGLS